MNSINLVWAILVIIIIILVYRYFRYSAYNTKIEKHCKKDVCTNFRVHREHHDSKKAAELMEEINSRNLKLLEHLRAKWLSDFKIPEPEKEGKIDVIPSSELLTNRYGSPITSQILEYIQERIQQLVRNYDQNNISEISPLNASGNTSYAENKQKLVLCLREKETGDDNHHDLHDINTVMFVVLHELAHIANNKWGHSYESGFWQLFKFLLLEAEKIEIYKPVDYSKNPVVYCGLNITYSPFYDSTIVLS